MSSNPSPDQLKEMVKNFRCGELQTVLSYAGQQKSGKKADLITRVERIITDPNRPAIFVNKVQELYSKNFSTRSPHNVFQPSSTPQSNSGNGYTALNGSIASSGTTIRINGFSVGSQSASASAASALGTHSPTPSNNSSSHSHRHHHHHRSPSPPAPPPLTAFGSKNSMMTLSQALSSASGYTPASSYNSYAPISATASAPRNKYTPADVRFRPLAFYDFLEPILPPTALLAESHSRTQQSMFTISLTAAQVARIRNSASGRPPDYSVQVQLRFCKYARESRGTTDVDDYLPSGLVVKLNSRIVTLPAPLPTSKPNAEPKRPPRPLDLTDQCKLSYGEETGFLVIDWNQWADGEDPTRKLPFALTVQLVQRINSAELLKRLNQNARKSIEYTQNFISAKFKSFQDADVAIASEKIRIALRCPLSRSCIDLPVRSSNCDHVQVYDAMSYLSMNEKKPTWQCPVCDRTAPYSTLYIDSMIERIIRETCTATGTDAGDLNPAELFFLPDLSWTTKDGSAEQVDLADSDDDYAPPTPLDVKPTPAALQAALTPEKTSSSSTRPLAAANSFSPASTCSTSSSCIMTHPESRSNSATGHRPSSSLAQPSNSNAPPRVNVPQQPSSTSSTARPVVVDLTLSDSDSEPPNKVARGSSSASVPFQQQSDYMPSSGTSRFTNLTSSSTVPKASAVQQSSSSTCLHSIDALLAGDEICGGHTSDSASDELLPPKARTVNRKSATKKRRGRAKTRVPSDSSEEEEEEMEALGNSDTKSDTSETSTASSVSTPETTLSKRKRGRQPAKATGRGRSKRKLAVQSDSDWSQGRGERVDDAFAARKSKRIADRPPASKAVEPSSGTSSSESESDSDVPLAQTKKNSRAKAASSASSSTVSPTSARKSAPQNADSIIPSLASVAEPIPLGASVSVLHPDSNRPIIKLKITPNFSSANAKVVDPNSQSAATPSYTSRSGAERADVMCSEDAASRVQQSSSSSNSKTQSSFPDWNSSPDWSILQQQQPQYDIASFFRTQDSSSPLAPVSPALPPHEPSPSLTQSQSSAFQNPSSEERNTALPMMPPPPPPLLSANQYNASSPTSPFARAGGTGTPSPPTNQLPPLPPLVPQFNAGVQLPCTYPGASSSSNYAGYQAGMTNSYPSFASQISDNRWSNGASGFGSGGRVPPMRFPNIPSFLDPFMTPSSSSSMSDLMNRAGSYGYSSNASPYGGYMQPNPANVAHPAFAPKPHAASANSYHRANSNFANLYPQPSTYQNNSNFPH